MAAASETATATATGTSQSDTRSIATSQNSFVHAPQGQSTVSHLQGLSANGAARPSQHPSRTLDSHGSVKDDRNQSQETAVAALISASKVNTRSKTGIPQIELETPSTASPTPQDTFKRWIPISSATEPNHEPPTTSFQGLSLDLSTKGLSEEIGTNNLKFSARGSMILDAKKVSNGHHVISAKTMPLVNESTSSGEKRVSSTRNRAVTSIAKRPQTRLMSTDEEQLSEKVRAFYSFGTDAPPDSDLHSATAKRMNLRWQDAVQDSRDSLMTTSRATSMTDTSKAPPSPTIPREQNELAGGVEDWQDVDYADVDRYGFIIPKSPVFIPEDENKGGIKRTPTTSGPGLQRVSTSLQLAAETPRRKHTLRRAPSNARSTRSGHDLHRSPSNLSLRSSKSLNLHRHPSTSRAFANKFPHNRDRRVVDEAGDMLTLPRSSTSATLAGSLADEGTSTTAGTYAPLSTPQSRSKELERQIKWEKMATKVAQPSDGGPVGGGMTFTFDTTSPKLIERTWKGIPDTWRATAWHCFLSTSVVKHNKTHPHNQCLSDETLTSMFYEYQERNCPDDVQIDIDVPRTISSHIMFRRRYRGGQRLLFRVLHAMSMHFAETGYVQGMAALAATLLAYYEEEKAFVMLVRLWELRGLEKLYKHGFGGLMDALDDFENHWLGQGELRKKLDSLFIGPTAYGTRWYLTLFNYSIPFPSQLRVWDVFMLLGDHDHDGRDRLTNTPTPAERAKSPVHEANSHSNANTEEKKDGEERANFGATLDVIHAASAALIDGMRGILLESDFENAMKVLTSWVPIQDEDLFMRVARAEWKMHQQRRRGRKKS